jgi:dienelactone hydrolase
MAPVIAWEPPAYVDRERFDEEELTIGPGGLEVPATLSVPRDGRDLPAVVLLAGSGPLDRDETIGPNKPFRDLAWGLASRGIVVLRFDKVTHAHGAAARANSAFTVTDEYLPHALAAIDRLRTHPSVDRRRIVVAGHSLGGTVAPRIAAAAGDLAGLVIMAGGAAPLHWVIVRQLRHIASLDPSTEAAAQPGIAAMARQAQRVDARDLTVDTPASELPFGTPASYWLDIRDWDAPAAAAALGLPVLVLQGERDYQATVDDDLPRWRAALGDLAGTTIRVFPGLDHCFFPGSGPSSPQASMTPGQHVDPAVLDALVGWLEGLPPR